MYQKQDKFRNINLYINKKKQDKFKNINLYIIKKFRLK